MNIAKTAGSTRWQKFMAKKKTKPWTTAKADAKFSLFIRERANWKCQRCYKDFSNNKGQLHCSHFWSRRHSSTRYDAENCVAACYSCHKWHWEIEKQGEYRDFMLNWLGNEKYTVLAERSRSIVLRIDAIKQLQSWLK